MLPKTQCQRKGKNLCWGIIENLAFYVGWFYINLWINNFIVTRNVAFKIRVTFSESKVDSAAWKLLIIRLIKFHLPEETSKVLTTFSIDIQDILLKDSICLFSWRWFLSLFLHCVQRAWEFTTLVCRQIKRFQSNQ